MSSASFHLFYFYRKPPTSAILRGHFQRWICFSRQNAIFGKWCVRKLVRGLLYPLFLLEILFQLFYLLIGDAVVPLVLKHVFLVGEVGESEVPGCRQEGGGPGGSPHPGKVTVISPDYKTKMTFIIIIIPHDYFHQNYDQTANISSRPKNTRKT